MYRSVPKKLEAEFRKRIIAFNESHAGKFRWKEYLAEAVDWRGRRVGALLGFVHWNWMYGAALWVDRRQRERGVGTRLLAAAEAAAYRRGTRNAYLESASFQAPGFYRKAGYRTYGQVPGMPEGHTTFFFHKKLRTGADRMHPGTGTLKIRLRTGTPKIPKPAVRWVGRRLGSFITRKIGSAAAKGFALESRDDEGALTAVCLGFDAWDWLHLDGLWVSGERRGKGLGSRLLQLAEREAKRRGCRGVMLRAFGFQSPGFWKKRGYKVFGTLRGLPKGSNCRYFMKKWKA